MKPGTLTSKRLWLPVLAMAIVVGLASWDYKQSPSADRQDQNPTDTLPKKKKITGKTDKKVRDLDDVIDELDAVDFHVDMEKIQEELAKAMKELDGAKLKFDIEKAMKDVDFEKMKLDIDKAMKEVDFEKIKVDVDKALKEVDFEKIKKEVQESVAKIDWDKMKKEMEEVKNIDYSKMQAEMKEEMKKVEEELKNIRPQIEKEMGNVKIELEKAKVEIEKAKAEMKEYKAFVDGLDKDGLINKKEKYTIRHEDGVLTINGKKASDQVYSKYRSFLDKHKKFNIDKSDDDFDIDID